MSRATGIDRSSLSRMERGRQGATLDQLDVLAAFFSRLAQRSVTPGAVAEMLIASRRVADEGQEEQG